MSNASGPVRTIVTTRVGLGVAQMGGDLYGMITVDDTETGGVIDILVDKSLLGELIAHGDDVRRRLDMPEAVTP